MNWIPRLLLTLNGAQNCPGVPLVGIPKVLETLGQLLDREFQVDAAKKGLTKKYTIGNETHTALEFLFGGGQASQSSIRQLKLRLETDTAGVTQLLTQSSSSALSRPATVASSDPLSNLHLTSPEQWGMGWTTYAGVYERAQAQLSHYTAAIDPAQPAQASARFWPMIAQCGLAFNLLILQKVQAAQMTDLKNVFGASWQADWDASAAAGNLFVIDLRLFESLAYDSDNQRFTPATVTLLKRGVSTQNWQMLPVAVRVTGNGGASAQVFVESNAGWVYALQAARTSVTVYGIWIGHVYHWHIVSAAMFKSLQQAVPESGDPAQTHPVRQLLDPQSKYLFEFDEVLLLGWGAIAPPTSIADPYEFLRLMSNFARDFFMDDPIATLARNGITKEDFSLHTDWDQYPIVKTILTVWDATAEYVSAFVDNTYPTDNAVASDGALRAWMSQAAASDAGNVKGLPITINTRAELKALLTSLLFRITMHGCARMLSTPNPSFAFVPNYPPCLQSNVIPIPTAPLSQQDLFNVLPVTGTIGSMMKFLYIFVFSHPYESFIPAYGVDSNLFFAGGPADPRNQALMGYREKIETLIEQLSPDPTPTLPQKYQWPLSIET